AVVVRGEVGDLRLERAGVFGGGVGDVAAEAEQGVLVVDEAVREFRRIGIQADAEQGVGVLPAVAELVDEGHGFAPAFRLVALACGSGFSRELLRLAIARTSSRLKPLPPWIVLTSTP